MLPSNRPADCVRLILVRLDSVLEARRRAMLLTLCTWDRRRRNAVSVFSRAMLEHCRQQRLRPVSDTGSSPFGLPTAVPSTWLKRARALNQAEKLQFEIMCQLHSSAVVQDSGSFSARRADEHYRTDDAVVPHRPLSARSFVTKQSHRKYQLARPDASDPELEPQRMEVPVIRTARASRSTRSKRRSRSTSRSSCAAKCATATQCMRWRTRCAKRRTESRVLRGRD